MTANVVNIELDPAANTFIQYDWTDPSTNLPIDLTGYTAKMQVREKSYNEIILLDFTSGNGKIVLGGTAGTIKILFAPSDTNTALWFKGVYDLYITKTADGTVTRVAHGFVTILNQVTS